MFDSAIQTLLVHVVRFVLDCLPGLPSFACLEKLTPHQVVDRIQAVTDTPIIPLACNNASNFVRALITENECLLMATKH